MLATAIEQLSKLREILLFASKGVDPKDKKQSTALNYYNKVQG